MVRGRAARNPRASVFQEANAGDRNVRQTAGFALTQQPGLVAGKVMDVGGAARGGVSRLGHVHARGPLDGADQDKFSAPDVEALAGREDDVLELPFLCQPDLALDREQR